MNLVLQSVTIVLMYAGTTIHGKSGGFIGVHQRIDRVSRRNLNTLPGVHKGFPGIKDILHFEGNNGPDGIKRKSPSVDEPWHYIDPTNPNDRQIVTMIMDHHANLVTALKDNNPERAAFEAAWMAHAITDALTPAHHYPLSDKIEQLWGKPKEERLTIREKNFIQGTGKRDTISRNWEYWGAKGIFMTHGTFELGIATSIKTYRFVNITPTAEWLKQADSVGFEATFLAAVHEIFDLGMYERYWKQGWNAVLVRETQKVLIPKICAIVTYAWYTAYREAGL